MGDEKLNEEDIRIATENAQSIADDITKLREAWDSFKGLLTLGENWYEYEEGDLELVKDIFKTGWIRKLSHGEAIRQLAIVAAQEGNLSSPSSDCSECPSKAACVALREMYAEIPIRLVARDSIIPGVQHVGFIMNLEDDEKPELGDGEHDLEHQEAMKRMGHEAN